ncbi:MAG: yahK [Frankiales bacterium]|nr:yahK [Frankiales bacterium]
MQTPALSIASPGAAPQATTIERRELGPHDISIAIAYAGICHSDIHQGRGDWGHVGFPLVPGHEIAGTVAAVGSSVTNHAIGDRVGVGCLVDSCRECEYCKAGEEQFCVKGAIPTYGGKGLDGKPTEGGYSQHIVVTEDFAVKIPDALSLDVAAPLLCAGITTFSPLRRWNAGPGRKVAVVGLGGLGHCAVQFAHAMGAEVTVLSQTMAKRDDGLALGADDYVATREPDALKGLRSRFDLILNTVSANLPLDRYLGMLRVDGAMVNVGAPADPDSFRAFSLIGGRRTLAGSPIGGIRETQEMLDFSAQHGLGARIETIDATQVGEAWDRVVASDVRYRFVIDVATIAS